MNLEAAFKRYHNKLAHLDGITANHFTIEEKGEVWAFKSSRRGALQVELYREYGDATTVGFTIKGVDTSGWNMPEVKNLDYHVVLAEAALLGRVGHNRTKLLRRKEICLKVDDAWHCTPMSNKSWIHYITTRKTIDSPPPVACYVCGNFTIGFHGSYHVCPVCFWEDNGFIEYHEDGTNNMTLVEAKKNYRRFGAVKQQFVTLVRPPKQDELP